MTKDAPFQVRVANWPNDLQALRVVRETVFIDEQKVPLELEWDDLDAQAIHVLAEDGDGQPIGTGRLLSTGQIGRMAVLKPWRGKGTGAALLSTLIVLAKDAAISPIYLNAQKSAIPFYRRQGFNPQGPEFIEANIIHQKMAL
jgi:predicted GNAT family N-acyltransferase